MKIDQDFFRSDVKMDEKSEEYIIVSLNLNKNTIVSVACGNAHSLLLAENGMLFSL